MTYPTAEEVMAGPDPESLFVVHRSLRSILPLVFGFFVSAVVVIAIISWLEDSPQILAMPLIQYISPRWLGIIPALFLLELLRRQYDDLYIFSDCRIQHRAGRLSLNYRIPSIKFVDIRSIRVKQSIWGRILGYGNVELGTAAQADSELVLQGILDPADLARLIDDLRLNIEETGESEGKKD